MKNDLFFILKIVNMLFGLVLLENPEWKKIEPNQQIIYTIFFWNSPTHFKPFQPPVLSSAPLPDPPVPAGPCSGSVPMTLTDVSRHASDKGSILKIYPNRIYESSILLIFRG